VNRNKDAINASLPGAVPLGIPIPVLAAGVPGVLQIDDFPGELWTRATVQTTLEVYP
jgi:hypothetical protein